MFISYKVHDHLIVLQIQHLSFDYFLVYLHQTFSVFKNKQMHNYEYTIFECGFCSFKVKILHLYKKKQLSHPFYRWVTLFN
jgi:hypothetical protein